MLKIDKTEISISGDDGVIISELASLANTVFHHIEEKIGIPKEETFNNFYKIYQMMTLIDSGMNIVEAAKLLDMENIISGITNQGPEGQECHIPVSSEQLDGLEELVANNIKNNG